MPARTFNCGEVYKSVRVGFVKQFDFDQRRVYGTTLSLNISFFTSGGWKRSDSRCSARYQRITWHRDLWLGVRFTERFTASAGSERKAKA